MNSLSQEQSNKILNLVREVEKLNDVERLLLYLQLPCGRAELPEGKYKSNNSSASSNGTSAAAAAAKQNADIFSKKSDQETTQTYTWILSHLEEDPNVSLPKQEVYDEYRAFCQANRFEPLCVADFGKAMKHALPCIKPRRLGQRGNSRYCYSGLRKKYKIEAPSLPNIVLSCEQQQQQSAPANNSNNMMMTEHHYPTNGSNSNSGNSRRAKSVGFNSPPGGCQFECSPVSCVSQGGGRSRTNSHDKIVGLKIEACANQQAQCVAIVPSDCCNAAPVACSGMQQQQQQLTSPEHNQQQQHQHHHNQASSNPYHQHQHQHQQQQQQQQSATFAHRCGTPDDDDYRHNYHDLNRPIVGPAIIPFSQSIHAQLAQQPAQSNCFISYANPQPPPPPVVNQITQDQQQQQQHELRPMDEQEQMQCNHHQQSVITTVCCCDSTKTSNNQVTVMAGNAQHQGHRATQFMVNQSSPDGNNEQQIDMNHQQHQAQQQQQSQQQHQHQQDHNHHHQQQQQQQNQQNQQQVDTNQLQLNLNLNLIDHCGGSNMEYCTSPFQSPAGTPYPIMSNYPTNTSAQDTQDYFSTVCPIQYSEH